MTGARLLFPQTALVFALVSIWTPALLAVTPSNSKFDARIQPRLSRETVMRLAFEEARRHGYKPEDFESARILEFNSKNQAWYVHFRAILKKPGSAFFVIVDDRKQTTEYFSG